MKPSCLRFLFFTFLLASTVAAQDAPIPLGLSPGARPLEDVDLRVMPPLDLERVRAEDEEDARRGLAPRFAIPFPVRLDPENAGTWETLADETLLWRLRLSSPGALSLNLGFSRYRMPEGGRLFLYSADYRYKVRPFTEADNAPHGELWTPIVRGDEIVVEVSLSAGSRGQLELTLASVNHDYLGFGRPLTSKSGSCNVDVACSVANPFRDQVRSVAVYSRGGSRLCTGALINNTAQDQRPYFLTANHCGVNSGNAATLVAYWNFENSVCRGVPGGGGTGDGVLTQFNTGSAFRAAFASSDFTLVELTSAPLAFFKVFWAGWDRTTGDFACSMGTPCVAIHHPNVDEKRITFSYQPSTTTSYGGTTPPGDGTHIHAFWGLGVTEPGSSGSPLFSPEKRIIGQLHGGPSICGGAELSDYYGRLSVSWTGGGTSATRLRDWLDPGNTGATTLDGANARTDFYTVTPCRVFDTRSTAPPVLACGTPRDFAIGGSCFIPPTAQAVSLNVAVTGPTAAGNLQLFPAGTSAPGISTINYSAGQTRANNAIISLGTAGAISARCSQGSTHVIVDVNGYFE